MEVQVVRGWPEDDALVAKADTIVIYSDGGGRHLAIPHLDRLRSKLAEGCGLVCLHYAVEMVPGEPGDAWVELLGGHFEINWSVNPHWVANFESLPAHPITHGVKPFAANDEWYFHMRFNPSDKVVPILMLSLPPIRCGGRMGHTAVTPMFERVLPAETGKRWPGHSNVLMADARSDSPVATTTGTGETTMCVASSPTRFSGRPEKRSPNRCQDDGRR